MSDAPLPHAAPSEDDIRRIVARLLDGNSFAGLTAEERAALATFAGRPQPADEGAERPLWYWIREKAFLWGGRLTVDLALGSELDPILRAAGARPLRNDSVTERLSVPVTRAGLLKAVRASLDHDVDSTSGCAALLAGLAGFDSLAPDLVKRYRTRERGPLAAFQYENLVRGVLLLAPPEAREVARDMARGEHEDDRAAALAWFAAHPDAIDGRELFALLRDEPDADVLARAATALIRCAREGFDVGALIERIVSESLWGEAPYRALAEAALATGGSELLDRLLASEDHELRAAIALQAIDARQEAALPALRRRLDGEVSDETDDEGAALLVAAIGTLDRGDRSWLGPRFTDTRWHVRCGAAIACLGAPGCDEQLDALRHDEDDDVATVARAVWLLRRRPTSTEACLALEQTRGRPILGALLLSLVAAMRAAGLTPPPPLAAHALIRETASPERLLSFARQHPSTVARSLREPAGEDEHRTTVALLGLADDPVAQTALEAAAAQARTVDDAAHALRELACLGPSRHRFVDVLDALVRASDDQPATLSREDVPILAALASRGRGSDLAVRAAAALGLLPDASESTLALLLSCADDPTQADVVARATLRAGAAADPLVRSVADLLQGTDAPTAVLAWLSGFPAPAVRAAAAGGLGRAPEHDETAEQTLLGLLFDDDGDVAAAALLAAADNPSPRLATRELIAHALERPEPAVRARAVSLVARAPDVAYLPALVQTARDTWDDELRALCVEALGHIAASEPDRGILVLTAASPAAVNRSWGINEPFDFQADDTSEALRLQLVALERHADPAFANANVGRRVLLEPLASDNPPAPSPSNMSRADFDRVALHLRVSFVDDETNAVVAEVSDEPTGELLNALFQQGALAVCRMSWA